MADITVHTPVCIHCGRAGFVRVDADAFAKYERGEGHVQDLFPTLPKDQREMLITGTHPACWDEMWAEPDEEL